jgi:condensin-2 complex subunit D3
VLLCFLTKSLFKEVIHMHIMTPDNDFLCIHKQVDAHVKSLKTLCKRKAKTAKQGDTLILKWAQQLNRTAIGILEQYIKDASDARGRSFVTPLSGKHKGMKEAPRSKSTLQAVVAVFTVGSLILACPDASVKDVTPLLHTIITSGNSEPRPEKLVGGTISFKELAPSLYIQSWDTLAKICLVDDKLAKRYIPIFVQVCTLLGFHYYS